MISPTYNLKEFVEATKNKKTSEIIFLAEKEAIDAWRGAYRTDGITDSDYQKNKKYQNKLKELINYMRSTIKPLHIKELDVRSD